MTVKKAVPAVCAAVLVAAVALLIRTSYRQTVEKSREIYEQAEELALEGRYEDADALLSEVFEENYYDWDFKGLMMLCETHISYDDGDIPGAYEQQSQGELQSANEALVSSWDSFREQLNTEYEAYQAEEERISELRSRVPYVGMAESDIAYTLLRWPSEEYTVSQVIDGEACEVNCYDFCRAGEIVFRVYCRDGEVYKVWDWRSKVISGGSSSDSTAPDSGNSSRKKSGSSSKKDPYNVYEYDDPEAFYEDNYYDFDGFEDAEDYWDDAQ